ncbi:MAG: hypothetical protein KDJ37_02520 [Hyphomicrobiaceae bacterium]|nr:hypothetical protein [Hyphomicrobiaceae bacterium]
MKFRSLASATMMVAVLAFGLLTGGTTSPAMAQRGDLVRIGEVEADLSNGKVSLDLSNSRGVFGELRIYNRGAPIMIDNVRVRYSDGSVHEERRTIDLRRGERTRPIDPDRKPKFVDEVIITYKTDSGSNRSAKLQVYGVQDRAGAREQRPSRPIAKPAPDKPAKPKPVVTAPEKPSKLPIKTTKAPAGGRCVGEGNLLIAKGNVGFGVDRDRIAVGGKFGKFDRIRLCVKDNDIELIELKINFVTGPSTTLGYAGLINAGTRTQPFGLKGDRFIDSLEMTYKKRENFSGRASVEVWGEIAEKWIDEEAELFNEGWVKLTTGDTVGFVGFELDKSPVRSHKKGFKQVRLVTRDRDITLDYFELFFADGKSQKIEAGRKRIEPGVGFGPIAIDGGPRIIKDVEARYRSRFFDKDAKGNERATVEIWGRR